jgi:predicted extracellular nuclease
LLLIRTTPQLIYYFQYIEGSSNNKALEISNATGVAVNLSIYSIKKNKAMALGVERRLPLSGTLSSGSKFTIVNSLMSSSCYATSAANLSTSATETFNGNDAVGLFKRNSD